MLFKDVLVEDGLKRQLINLVRENRVSHAQLFLGNPGSHKFALAVAYAQYLCCQNRGEDDSCGVCPSCKKFEKLAHPDLHLVFPNCTTDSVKKDNESKLMTREFVDFVQKSNYHLDFNQWLDILGGKNKQPSINIRDCATIINQNSIRSYEGGYKIYILWMVDRLYYDAAPKLLKTLEEPENKTLFLLLADDSTKILPTILSRTQLVKIPSMNKNLISKELIEHYDASPEQAEEVAEIAEGDFVKALSLLQGTDELHDMLAAFQFILESAIGHKQGDLKKMNFWELRKTLSELTSMDRERQKRFFTYVIKMFRNLFLFSMNNEALIHATQEERAFAQMYKEHINLKNITPIVEACNNAVAYIARNGNSNLVFMDFYFQLAELI